MAPGRSLNHAGTNSKLEWPQHLKKSKAMRYTYTMLMEAPPSAAAPRRGTSSNKDCSVCSSIVVTPPGNKKLYKINIPLEIK